MMKRHSNRSRPSAKPRKGVAMLLVLISLMTATVITAAYLASRDNSGAIGENVANASAARWGAASGLTVAATMLETESDWRTAHANGMLLPDFPFADCLLDLSLTDLETNGPPGPNTTYLKATSTADAGGIEHDASATLIVAVPNVANVDLAEFALFAAEEIELKGQSRLLRWSEAPLGGLGLPIFMGTLSPDMGAITIQSDALAVDAVGWLPPGATANAVNNASELDMHARYMLDAIALPDPPEPVVSGLIVTLPTILPSGSNLTLSLTNFRISSLDLSGTVTLNYSGQRAFIVSNNLNIDGTLRVSGDATIIVHGNLRVESSGSIELVGDGTLRIFVGGDVDIRGYVGEAGGAGGGPNSDGLGHVDVSRIHLIGMQTADEPTWRLRQSALVKGCIYAPQARMRMTGESRLCGRIVAGAIELADQAVMVYDHALDRRTGYTNLASAIYDADGRIRQAFAELESLDDADLALLAASENLKVRAINKEYGTGPMLTTSTAEGESTPRPVSLTLVDLSYDTAVAGWEN